MSDKSYNGWTNYATWRVNLELFDGLDPRDYFGCARDVYDLSRQLEAYAEEAVLGEAKGLAADYAAVFLSDVDFYSIAEHMAEDYDLLAEEDFE